MAATGRPVPLGTAVPPRNVGELSLMVKVARRYHEQGCTQSTIAAELHLSQSRVSRLLSEAGRAGIVRTTVLAPAQLHTDLEDEVRDRYRMQDVVVVGVDAGGGEPGLMRALGGAAGAYLEATLNPGDSIGISSWSATLLATVESMTTPLRRQAREVAQLIGGLGRPEVQLQATHLIQEVARLTKSRAHLLPAPGLLPSSQTREAFLDDPYVREIQQVWQRLTIAVVGIGSVRPSPLLHSSGNSLSDDELNDLVGKGAVGDVCLRFIDSAGRHLRTELDDRVLGISPDDYVRIPRRVGVAGGRRKFEAIRASLLGGWVNILVTDVDTAQRLAA